LKFTLKSDYALNIIAIDKPPKYEVIFFFLNIGILLICIAGTHFRMLLSIKRYFLLNRKKQPIASLLCQAPIVPMQFRHFYRKRSGRRKPEKETGWQQQVSL